MEKIINRDSGRMAFSTTLPPRVPGASEGWGIPTDLCCGGGDGANDKNHRKKFCLFVIIRSMLVSFTIFFQIVDQ